MNPAVLTYPLGQSFLALMENTTSPETQPEVYSPNLGHSKPN